MYYATRFQGRANYEKKRQAERMPRKMKKRHKKLMAFYDKRRKEYEQNLFLKVAILKKLKNDLGISALDVESIEIKDNLNTNVKLKGSIRQAEIIVNIGGLKNANNNEGNKI